MAMLRAPVACSERATAASITIELVIGQIAHEAQDVADRLARGVAREHEIGDDDRARVDEGVPRLSLLVLKLDDGVERIARGLASDGVPKAFAVLAKREG